MKTVLKLICLLAAAATTALPLTSHAQTRSAPDLVNACPEPVITVLPFEVREDYSQPMSAIWEKAANPREQTLAYVEVLATVGATVRSTGACRLVSVEAGYKDAVLRIPNEIPARSCEFKHLYRHERQHVEAYEAHLRTLGARIQERLGQLGLSPVDEQAEIEVMQALQPLISEVKAVHQEIDSDAAYRDNLRVCNGGMRNYL